VKCNFSSASFVFVVTIRTTRNATIQSAYPAPIPLFTAVISGLFTSGASFSLAHEYSLRNPNTVNR